MKKGVTKGMAILFTLWHLVPENQDPDFKAESCTGYFNCPDFSPLTAKHCTLNCAAIVTAK